MRWTDPVWLLTYPLRHPIPCAATFFGIAVVAALLRIPYSGEALLVGLVLLMTAEMYREHRVLEWERKLERQQAREDNRDPAIGSELYWTHHWWDPPLVAALVFAAAFIGAAHDTDARHSAIIAGVAAGLSFLHSAWYAWFAKR